ncbi:trypsin-like peptidase domain-containing protein [Rhodanobacter sp. B2A1Ga4]|uniref:trypsin-like peptidase domain-containing protein n=1 Tax=Rhodanobacter sp. B2A1Ga4 TaxID=2778647 RepID=UPI001B39A886|nr:trypsin-like peptidase domain-containing protein [Rhodanobacter sp. B2A1Ga4]MBQ4855823.1 trypsin-like peptidase domain-containing protein [Rhodanobacter sp. B2A1Ga4]
MSNDKDGNVEPASPGRAYLKVDDLGPPITRDFTSRTFGYRGEVPRWTAVSAPNLTRPPYRRICAVSCGDDGAVTSQGSGWYHASGLVLTAAHVVAGYQTFSIRFANSTSWIPVPSGSIEIDPGYRRRGVGQPCSPFDLARIHIDPIAGEDCQAQLDLPDDELYRAIGFQGDVLVEHAGTGRVVGPFVTYEAETGEGHSGCPIFYHQKVCGIHVGYFSDSREYLTGAAHAENGCLNSAVRITA